MRFVISRFPKVVTSYSYHNTENVVDSNATGSGPQRLIDAPKRGSTIGTGYHCT